MAQENISFFECDDDSYIIVDNYLFGSRFYEYEDSYKNYDINVNNILPNKKSGDEYVIRYIDANKSIFAQLQFKIKNFSGKIEIFTNNDKIIFIHSDDKELFKKCREIWNRIIKLMSINNAADFVKTTSDDNEFIIADVHENTSFVEGSYEGSYFFVFNDYPKTLLIQAKNINAHKQNIKSMRV